MPRIDPPVCSNGCCRDAVHRRHYRPPEIVRRIRLVISAESRVSRQRAAVQALLATLIKPEGAQGNTQSPPILECSGVITTSTSYLPAPMLSPVSDGYRVQVQSIAETLNRMTPGALDSRSFDSLASGIALLETILPSFSYGDSCSGAS
jgi:hypothetical protein